MTHEVFERIENLTTCLRFCLHNKRVFTTGERIMLHQERAKLMRGETMSQSIITERKIKKIINEYTK